MTLRTGEDTLIWRRELWIALCGGIVLEEALDLSSDRILNGWMIIITSVKISSKFYIYIYIYSFVKNPVLIPIEDYLMAITIFGEVIGHLIITIFIAFNKNNIKILKPTCYMMHQQFNIQQLYALPTLYLCVLYLSENKQRLVPLTA